MSNLQNPRAALEESFGGGGEREAAPAKRVGIQNRVDPRQSHGAEIFAVRP
jgi:hypothetical protein